MGDERTEFIINRGSGGVRVQGSLSCRVSEGPLQGFEQKNRLVGFFV